KKGARGGGKEELGTGEGGAGRAEQRGKRNRATPATAHSLITVKPANASVGPRPKTIALRQRSASWLHTGWASASRSVGSACRGWQADLAVALYGGTLCRLS